jgi:hypothetical protein
MYLEGCCLGTLASIVACMVANIPGQSSQFNVYHFHDMGRGWMVNLVELSMLSSDAGMLTGVLFFCVQAWLMSNIPRHQQRLWR